MKTEEFAFLVDVRQYREGSAAGVEARPDVTLASPRAWCDWFFAPGGAPALILRLFSDYGRHFRGRYAIAFGYMAVVAVCTAASAYLIGRATNEAYIARNFDGIVVIAILTIVIFVVKGLSIYGQAVTLYRGDLHACAEDSALVERERFRNSYLVMLGRTWLGAATTIRPRSSTRRWSSSMTPAGRMPTAR